MPLRDHFRGRIDEFASWEALHGGWPMMIVLGLANRLPAGYSAQPQVHVGAEVEIDVATFEHESAGPSRGGGAAIAYLPAPPTLETDADVGVESAYEVRVYDERRGRRLVAAIELVSPANKDRPETRAAFAAKCAALARREVAVTIVDVVTNRTGAAYADLLACFGLRDPALGDAPLYAGTCRLAGSGPRRRLRSWAVPLALGAPLPTLPLWLAPDRSIPLDLEDSYEQCCRALRIA